MPAGEDQPKGSDPYREPLAIVRAALHGDDAWIVGGAVRDRMLGRAAAQPDIDLIVPGDPEPAARRIRDSAGRGSAVFSLSDAFGAWRVVGPDRQWQVDLTPRHDAGLEADLRARDLTANAIAEPLAGGDVIDPTGGVEDLRAGLLRMVVPEAFDFDPLRVVRVARLAVELGLTADPDTVLAARSRAAGLGRVSGERLFAELRAMLAGPDPPAALRLLDDLAATEFVLPEVAALRGVEQTVYHHRDAYGHTLEVLERVTALERDPEAIVGAGRVGAVQALLAEPLADETTRGGALRWGALLHDIAKPLTRTVYEGGAVGFPGHDRAGAVMTDEILERLRASARLRAHVAALSRHHLRAGFLVRQRPLSRRAVHEYLVACGEVAADVTLLSMADRLATRGRKAEVSIARHMEVAVPLLDAALAWHLDGAPAPLIRGDDLADALGIAPGPRLGELLAELAHAQYAGEVTSAAEAIDHARRLLSAD